jgi:2-oxo-4-hydroxy-4-carboxy-5-ureidoimidazoline decarboxylase
MTAAGSRQGLSGGLAGLNARPAEAARQLLLGCCSSARWAGALLAGRPYPSGTRLLQCSDEAVACLTPADLRDALAGHPRIGAGAGAGRAGADGRWSRPEQAGVTGADEATLRELAAGNRAYEQRFGHIYLVCATGRTAAELLAVLRARLANDSGTEWDVVRSELQKINRIRLGKLLGGGA